MQRPPGGCIRELCQDSGLVRGRDRRDGHDRIGAMAMQGGERGAARDTWRLVSRENAAVQVLDRMWRITDHQWAAGANDDNGRREC
jgi:hypothetical protein